MSKLMSWTHYCIQADMEFASGSETHYQLKGVAELASMEQAIMSWRENVIHSTFAPERKRFCLKIDGYLRAAYAKASNQPTGPMSSLREPFMLLKMALRQLMIIRDFDDRVPVRATEAPRASRGAEDAWLTIKLQYAKACLVLLIRIFWLVLPKFPEWWEEIEASLNNEDWLKQFILDSRKSERLAVFDRERLPDVLEQFRRQKTAIDNGKGPEKGLDIEMLI
ncbi:hypothetical protein PG996_005688 [Apiospora saccharicola]|uniref:Uncharacterized protein n=1 Tax=Apiospora saccharicola TaxID=335842 RepID=A0ABR1VM57_9PEZI